MHHLSAQASASCHPCWAPRLLRFRPALASKSRGAAVWRLPYRPSLLTCKAGGQRQPKYDWEALPPGTKEVQEAFRAAEFQVKRGDMDGATRTLEDAIQLIKSEYGETDLLGFLHTQLFQLHFRDARYKEALADAQAAYRITAGGFGADSSEACLHGMRLGVALLAAGEAEAARPLLMSAGAMLEGQSRELREKLRTDALEGKPPQEEILMAATHLLAAGGESKYYAALCLMTLEAAGAGKGAAEESLIEGSQLQAMMMSGIEDMAQVMHPGNDLLVCALREHQRLVDAQRGSGSEGAARLEQQQKMLAQTIEGIQAAREAAEMSGQ